MSTLQVHFQDSEQCSENCQSLPLTIYACGIYSLLSTWILETKPRTIQSQSCQHSLIKAWTGPAEENRIPGHFCPLLSKYQLTHQSKQNKMMENLVGFAFFFFLILPCKLAIGLFLPPLKQQDKPTCWARWGTVGWTCPCQALQLKKSHHLPSSCLAPQKEWNRPPGLEQKHSGKGRALKGLGWVKARKKPQHKSSVKVKASSRMSWEVLLVFMCSSKNVNVCVMYRCSWDSPSTGHAKLRILD